MLRYIPCAIILVGSLQAISAQTPAYQSPLLIQPALTTNKCLTAASNADGAIVSLQGCTGGDSQEWTFEGGSVKVFGNKCLTIPQNAVDGAFVQLSTCRQGDPNQQLYYDHWVNQISWQNRQKCVDLTAGNINDGTRPSIYPCAWNANQIWNTGYMPNKLPKISQEGQYGTNVCGTGSSQDSNCQTAWLNSLNDFCLWGPPLPNSIIGNTEAEQVTWCSKSGRGTRLFPADTFRGVHVIKTPEYIQITGQGNFTKINVRPGDAGGELDNMGADAKGNPIGGLVFGNSFGNGAQYHEWTEFLSDGEFCIRACVGPNAKKYCNHVYDLLGCSWNMPGNYEPGFQSCDADSGEPMGVYGTSTYVQGPGPTPNQPIPPPHPAPASSNCVTSPTVRADPIQRRALQRLPRAAEPTPPPAKRY